MELYTFAPISDFTEITLQPEAFLIISSTVVIGYWLNAGQEYKQQPS